MDIQDFLVSEGSQVFAPPGVKLKWRQVLNNCEFQPLGHRKGTQPFFEG
jgi:hypothetical protein